MFRYLYFSFDATLQLYSTFQRKILNFLVKYIYLITLQIKIFKKKTHNKFMKFNMLLQIKPVVYNRGISIFT